MNYNDNVVFKAEKHYKERNLHIMSWRRFPDSTGSALVKTSSFNVENFVQIWIL